MQNGMDKPYASLLLTIPVLILMSITKKCSYRTFKSYKNTSHGAGDGNRTHVTSLEGWGSTIELHPPVKVERFASTKPEKWSGRRDSDSRHPPWQGGTLPLSYYRINGALGRNRTTDTEIFSLLLYRLSYQGKWRRGRGSNPRPPA